jgi:hypothetical protein
MNINRQYKKITESLRLISLPFEDQVQCFPKFVEVPFEVIDTFENAFLLLPSLIESEIINYKIIANLLRLYNLVNITSSNPKFSDLDDEQFSKSDEWNRVRELSKKTLQLMGEPIQKPDLDFI